MFPVMESGFNLISAYAPVPGRYDEALSGPGEVRHSWRGLVGQLYHLGSDGLSRRRDQARRLLRDNGVAYTANAGEAGAERPWRLDPVPLVLDAVEWSGLVSGVVQRARLAEAFLGDLYGPGRLISDGTLHPATVLNHPQFLRAMHGVPVPGRRRLQLHAVDLQRGPDGRWRVTAEHAQAPAGAGFALENRIVLSRVLAEVYRDSQVERVAGFFMALRTALREMAPAHRDNPRIVLLTPGPFSETYFEHAYLARYLGYTLVEGADLTVRNDKVYLKTLGGLHQVDVILRRLGDEWCDPLELRGDSQLGIAGLMGVVRAGNVAIANGLGSGAVENLALLPAGDLLCRRLLGESLELNSVATYWGGDTPAALTDPSLLIRPAFSARSPGRRLAEMPASERDALRARLVREPSAWVAQEALAQSTAPVWTVNGIYTGAVSLRLFAVANPDSPTGWQVMPGGLVRISDPRGTGAGYTGNGDQGGTKDLWIQSERPVSPVSLLLPPSAPVQIKRGGADLPSRVADNLYWVGRYAERIEDTARLLRSGMQRLADGAASGPGMLAVLGMLDQLKIRERRPGEATEQIQQALTALAFDVNDGHSLPAVRELLRRAAAAVRDRVSNDTWQIINRLGEGMNGTSGDLGEALATLDRALAELSALAGMGTENSTRGPAWRFLDLGRRMERAQFTVDLLRSAFLIDLDDRSDLGEPGFEVLLEIADSSITYRSRYLTTLQPAPVLDLLLLDDTNPRSVAFQLEKVAKHLKALPSPDDKALLSECERLAIRLRSETELADPEELCHPTDGRRTRLDELLELLADGLADLSDHITARYLNHALARRSPAITGGGRE